MYRKIIEKKEFREYAKKAAQILADIVGTTMGPAGLPVLISRENEVDLVGKTKAPLITKDGISVGQTVKLADPHLDLIVQATIDTAAKTNRLAGDGTTSAVVLANAILQETFKKLDSDSNLNPQLVKLSIMEASEKIIKYLDFRAIPLENNYELLENVAKVSANGDAQVAKILREAFEKVGSEGTISVDYGNGLETQLEIVEGFEINRGLEGGTRLTNDKNQTKFECENVHVILYDGNLNNYPDLVHVVNNVIGAHYFEEAQKEGKSTQSLSMPPLLIVANEFSQSVLTSLMIQKIEYGMNVAAVRSPHQTKIRTQMLDDLAVMLAGSRLGNGNKSLTNCTWEDIGIAKRVVATQWNTIFYGYEENEEEILQRIDQLRAQKQMTRSEYDRHLFEDRAAGLACAVAKIAVGGTTDLEILELYHRYEDALNACKAAISEGIVPGGGVTYLKAAQKLKGKTIGEEILISALQTPIEQILRNVGILEADIIKIKDTLKSSRNKTFDARYKKMVNPLKAGIIDPVLVLKTALKNAVSIASLLSTAGGGIIFEPQGVKK